MQALKELPTGLKSRVNSKILESGDRSNPYSDSSEWLSGGRFDEIEWESA